MTHHCPVKDCKREDVSRDHLMCPPHWRKLPRPLRRELWRAWRDARRAFGKHNASNRSLVEYFNGVRRKRIEVAEEGA